MGIYFKGLYADNRTVFMSCLIENIINFRQRNRLYRWSKKYFLAGLKNCRKIKSYSTYTPLKNGIRIGLSGLEKITKENILAG